MCTLRALSVSLVLALVFSSDLSRLSQSQCTTPVLPYTHDTVLSTVCTPLPRDARSLQHGAALRSRPARGAPNVYVYSDHCMWAMTVEHPVNIDKGGGYSADTSQTREE